MKLRILGCSGGIGGEHLRTTSLLVDDDVLIDAGTGVGDLPIADLARIDHVFLTHTHLDHIACLPLIIDSVGDRRDKPLTVYGTPAVLDILRKHIFNWLVWPDFAEVPSAENPFMRYQAVELLKPVTLGGRVFTPLPVDHTVPAVGYRLDSGYRQPGLFRGYRALRRVLARGQPDRQPAPSDHRMRVPGP